MIAIAIDGPAGAGKSTIARAVAKELGFIYVDTGALYRTVAYAMIQRQVAPSEESGIETILDELKIELAFVNSEQRVFLNGVDVSDHIRTPEISMAASAFSALPCVRAFLLSLQREIAIKNNIIMDGRDIGTVVLPDAQIKIFLTASAEDRAMRRHEEMISKGQPSIYEEVLADMKQRDYNDAHRKIAPLRPAEDAILLDTTGNTLQQSVALLSKTIKERLQ